MTWSEGIRLPRSRRLTWVRVEPGLVGEGFLAEVELLTSFANEIAKLLL